MARKSSRGLEIVTTGIIVALSFWAGRQHAGKICTSTFQGEMTLETNSDVAILPVLEEKPVVGRGHNESWNLVPTENDIPFEVHEMRHAQLEFQAWLHGQQSKPSDCNRILEVTFSVTSMEDKIVSTWVESLEVLAKVLQIALSTERRLVLILLDSSGHRLEEKAKAKFCEIQEHELYCKWMARTSRPCKHANTSRSATKISTLSPLRRGIILSEGESDQLRSNFFNTAFYGPNPVARLPHPIRETWPMTWLLDSGLVWERIWGSNWLRAHLLDYLWTELVMEDSLTTDKAEKGEERSTGRHATLVWDANAHELLFRRFARNASKTHGWNRIDKVLSRLEHIAQNYSTNSNKSYWEIAVIEIEQVDANSTTSRPVEVLAQGHHSANSSRVVTFREGALDVIERENFAIPTPSSTQRNGISWTTTTIVPKEFHETIYSSSDRPGRQ